MRELANRYQRLIIRGKRLVRPKARLVILAFCFDSSHCQKEHLITKCVRKFVCQFLVPFIYNCRGCVLNLFFLAPKIVFFAHHNILKYEHNDSLVRTVQRVSQVSRSMTFAGTLLRSSSAWRPV